MKEHYKRLDRRTVTQTPDSGGGFTESVSDSQITGFIGVLSAYEILKNKQIGRDATARLLTSSSLNITDRIVDSVGYFSLAGTVYEVVWIHKNPFEDSYYDLRQI